MFRRDFLRALLTSAAASRLELSGLAAAQGGTGDALLAVDALVLRYRRAASRWVEALPIGNGELGAMVFGGIGTDRVQLNHDTLWSGGPTEWNNPGAKAALPEVRRAVAERRYVDADRLSKKMMGPFTEAYMPLGDLVITHDHGDIGSEYGRSLNLQDATVETGFRIADVTYRRSAFVSHPARVLVLQFLADSPKNLLHFTARLQSQLRYATSAEGNVLVLSGQAPAHTDPSYHSLELPVQYRDDAGMRFVVKAVGQVEGQGTIRVTHDGIRID